MEIITDPPQRALVVTPHPDDCEGGCGGTISRWVREAGTQVVVVLCTDGGKGTSDRRRSPPRLAALRAKEQLAASSVLGAVETVMLGHPDGGLEDGPLFRSQLVREIRRHRPEAIFCIDPYRTTTHTHRDHRMSGQVALDAAFTYAWSYLHFPEQIAQEGLQPHRVREAFLWGTESPDAYVDISNYLEAKADSLLSHVSQFPDPQGRRARVGTAAAETGKAAGLPFAEGFRRIRFELDTAAWRYLHA
ncbi:MAG: PIG-L family deacetylase [SAR202 cluster bacterium]|nr:PIG-L family deacetylase [SAR202 cluster bacterium]